MLEQIKKRLRPTIQRARLLTQRLRNFAPNLPVTQHKYRLIRLGTDYGGWTFVDEANLNKSVIISCGLGEDASFDVAFATKYGAKIIMIDPTPRAISHYKELMSRLGQKQQRPFTTIGAQPTDAYDLSKISAGQLQLCEKALWNQNTRLQFFAPRNPTHVSHSIVNYQHSYATDTAHIDVEAITIDKLFADYGIQSVPLIKLDIEGAEVEVLIDMVSKAIYPSQVLVEYDELLKPSKKTKQRIESVHGALTKANYELIFRHTTNFSYIRQTN